MMIRGKNSENNERKNKGTVSSQTDYQPLKVKVKY